MGWVESTLQEFGRQIGVSDLGFGSQGVAHLQRADGGFLAIESARRGPYDEVLVYLGHPLGFNAGELVRGALDRVHFSHAGAWDLQIGTQGQGSDTVLIVLTRIPERAFTLQSLNAAIEHISRWLEAITS